MNAFGYEGIGLGYHFVSLNGKEKMTVDLPYIISEVRIDDKNNWLLGFIISENSSSFVIYDYEKQKEVKRFDFGQLLGFPLCSSAYSPEKQTYFVFTLGMDTNSILFKISLDSGFVGTDTLDFNPVNVVYDHKTQTLLMLVNILNGQILDKMNIIRYDPFNSEILNNVTTELDGVSACSAGFDYEKNAYVTYTFDKILFIDPQSGQTIEKYDVNPNATSVIFWRD